jgi:hypothetical protein
MLISEIIFIVVSILISAGGTAYFASKGQYIGMALYLIGSIIVLVVYGLLWFGPSGQYNQTPQPWPPVLNTCPDYLTYYKRNNNGSVSDTCVDRIGVSKNASISVYPPGGNVDNNDIYFFPLKRGESRAELCGRVINAGLTWEGVTDGESCFNQSTGTASGPAGSGGSSSSSSSCPSS